jgi:hypothetical protein
MRRSDKKRRFHGAMAAASAAVAVLLLIQLPGVHAQDKKGKEGKKQGAASGAFGPYYEPPETKGGPFPRTPDGKRPDLTGHWFPRLNRALFNIEQGAIVDPPDGKIPYRPEAREKAKDLEANNMFAEPEAHCFMSGVPHSAYQQFGFQVLQTEGHVVLLQEYAHSYRIIPIDGPIDGRPHVDAGVKLFMGDSVGRWEGDTLVIDTTNQNGKTWFDMVGNFQGENIHVVERITPVDSENIRYEATVEDPTSYTSPWKIAGTWGRGPFGDYELMEFACQEGNQDLEHYVEGEGGGAKQIRGK